MWGAIAALIGAGIDYSQSKDASAKAYKNQAKQINQSLDRQEEREKEREAAQARAADKSRRDSNRRGRASNILTSAAGLREEDSAKRTLLAGSN